MKGKLHHRCLKGAFLVSPVHSLTLSWYTGTSKVTNTYQQEETLTEWRTFLHLRWTQQLLRCKYNLGWRKEETLALPCLQVQAEPQDLPASVLLASCPEERDRRNGPSLLSLLFYSSEPAHYSVLVLAWVSEQAHMSTSERLAPYICS